MKDLLLHLKILFRALASFIAVRVRCSIETAEFRLAVTLIAIALMFGLSIAFIVEKILDLLR